METLLRGLESFLFSWSPSLTPELRRSKGRLVCWLFLMKVFSSFLTALLAPLRESLTMGGDKHWQSRLMLGSTLVAVLGQALVASSCAKIGAMRTYRLMYRLSSLLSLVTFVALRLEMDLLLQTTTTVFFLYHSFFAMTCVSMYWSLASDGLAADSSRVFGAISAGGESIDYLLFKYYSSAIGTVGTFTAALMLATSSSVLGTGNLLLVASAVAVLGSYIARGAETQVQAAGKENGEGKAPGGKAAGDGGWRGIAREIVEDFNRSVRSVAEIWDQRLLRSAFLYALFYSSVMGLNLMEKRAAARRSGLSKESYAGSMGANQICKPSHLTLEDVSDRYAFQGRRQCSL